MLSSNYLFLPSILFYLLGFGIIIYVLIFRLFSTDHLSQVTDKYVKALKFFLILFSLVFASIFTQVYQPLPIFFNKNSSIIDILIIFILIGPIAYFLFHYMIGYLLDKETENIKRKSKFNYSVFILAILLFSTIFAIQSIGVISSNKYEISSDNIRVMQITPDFTKLAYIIQHSHTNYLVYKDLETDITNVFSLCEKRSWYDNSTSSTFELCLKNSLNHLWISPEGDAIFIEDTYKTVYKFDLNVKRIIDVYPYAMSNKRDAILVNSSLYLTGLTYLNNSRFIKVWNHHEEFLIPALIPNNTYIDSFFLSPDLSKLAMLIIDEKTGYYPSYINFYTLKNFIPSLVGNITLQTDPFGINFDLWNNNSSIFYYSFYNGTNSNIFSFNFINFDNQIILNDFGWYHSFSVNSDNSLLILNNPMKIFSIDSGEPILVTETYNASLWDSSYSKSIVLDQDSIKLISYNKKTNAILEEKTLDVSLTERDYYIYDSIQQLLISGTAIFLVLTIIFYKRIEKWTWISPFKS